MAKGVNKVIIIGNLGKDPDVRFSANGTAAARLDIATSEMWKEKDSGSTQVRTEWHKVVLFKRLAEIAGEYLKKGSKVYIEGTLRTRKWQDKSGEDRYSTEIHAQDMQMLDSKNERGNVGESTALGASMAATAKVIAEDDIPF